MSASCLSFDNKQNRYWIDTLKQCILSGCVIIIDINSFDAESWVSGQHSAQMNKARCLQQHISLVSLRCIRADLTKKKWEVVHDH